MSQKEFVLVLAAVIFFSGGYYLYTNSLWPFVADNNPVVSAAGDEIYAVSGLAKEVYDSVIILEVINPYGGYLTGELRAAIDSSTDIFSYDANYDRAPGSVSGISVGDRITLTSDSNIAKVSHNTFLASTVAVYQ